VSGQELGAWLRRQREARALARSEMARQLIKVAHSNGDTSIPGVNTLSRYVCRWESGAIGLTDRYKLYYCQAFGIPFADLGVDRGAHSVCRISVSGDVVREIFGLLDDLRDVFREWREIRAAIEAQTPARKLPARAAVDRHEPGPGQNSDPQPARRCDADVVDLAVRHVRTPT
jgi:hypothetical protein